MTLTYNPILAKVKVYPHAKNEGHQSNGSDMRVPVNRWTDKCYAQCVASRFENGKKVTMAESSMSGFIISTWSRGAMHPTILLHYICVVGQLLGWLHSTWIS